VLLLTDDVATAAYFEATVAEGAPPKAAANWILGDIAAFCNVRLHHTLAARGIQLSRRESRGARPL
jgi:Asp-tRNA(Asn)/Glu-tRNA(Gln) amidotransferase B subunit